MPSVMGYAVIMAKQTVAAHASKEERGNILTSVRYALMMGYAVLAGKLLNKGSRIDLMEALITLERSVS